MFGYVTICEPELKVKDLRKYKAYYCGLCQELKEAYGAVGQMTLTYDMTFVIVLLTSLYESQTELTEHRCKVHPVKKQKMLRNEITQYGADMNILLTYYKLADDWIDEKSIRSLLGNGFLRKRAREVIRRYPRQSKAIRRSLRELSKCEQQNSMDLDKTAGCFGELMAELFVYKRDMWEERLRKIGFYLGKFIYLMDAYEDFETDKRKNAYNVFRVQRKEDMQNLDTFVKLLLTSMMSECAKSFERLPILMHADILRNVLYSGVWTKYEYNRLKRERKQQKLLEKQKAEKQKADRKSATK
jgi:hypothetical protein